MKTLLYLLIIAGVLGCQDKRKSSPVSSETVKKAIDSIPQKKVKRATKRDLDFDNYYAGDTSFITWRTKHADTTQYLCEMIIREDFILHNYSGQCAYYYFTYKTSDTTMDMLWSYKVDCTGGVDFLEKSNGVKKHPKLGDTFCTFTLKNDSVIKVKYYFPEWVRRVNTIAKDSLFPAYFYLKRRN
jgi:hypothetical protein